VVSVSAPAGMPQRQFSAAILGGVWPLTDPQNFQSAADAQHAKGVDLLSNADSCREAGNQVASEQSGHMIDGFVHKVNHYASTYMEQADRYFTFARVCEECARLVYGLREDLDQIDAEAHEAIKKVMEAIQQGFPAAIGGAQIMEIVAAARAAATAKSAEVTSAISAKAAEAGLGSGGQGQGSGADPVDPELRDLANQGVGMGGGGPGGPRSNGMPTSRFPGTEPPASPLDMQTETEEDGVKPHRGGGLSADSDEASGADQQELPTQTTSQGEGATPTPSDRRGHGLQSSEDGPPAPTALPVSGGGGSSASSLGSAGSLGSGGVPKMPSAPSGLGSGGLPTQGLSSPGGLGSAGMPSSGGVPGAGGLPQSPLSTSAGAPSDFSRGLSAGLSAGGGPATFAPPVSPQPTGSPGSAVPSGVPSAPAGATPSTVAAGSAASSAPAVPSSAPASPGVGSVGSAGVPAAPMGPLPPFGSDVARSATPAAAVTPSAGPAPAPTAPTGGGGSSAGPVAPLPPGVVGSGVGASAGAASEAIRSSLPDPLLASASQLLYQLLHDSRAYPYMDWCVGVFRTSSGVETLIVNSEGAGYLPAGVFVPRSARMLFADGGLPPEFRARWFSWANPAETMLAYAKLASEHRSDVELWELAVSTDLGGSSMPARSVIEHFEDCSRSLSPISDGAPPSPLDDTHSHRLETLNRAEYARLTGFGEGPLPDRSEAWRTTLSAAEMALGRAGSVRDLAVSPVIREILQLLGNGLPVSHDRWRALEAESVTAAANGSAMRPGWLAGNEVASPYVLACHDLARLTELLLLWNPDNGPDIKYADIAYLAMQIVSTPWGGGS